MFQEIYVPFDNSEFAFRALDIALQLAVPFRATVVGSHVYAAGLHDRRFKTLESGLPEEFQHEREMERQREVHDTLITDGLELITDSYLTVMAEKCQAEDVPFRGVSLEGRNWKTLVENIAERGSSLVVMGAYGLGRAPESLVGTVCERVVRRTASDVLVVRTLEDAPSAPIVVCLDGSAHSWGGLELGLALAQAADKPLQAISAFDPYFHYTVFGSLKEALTERAKEVFKFDQQERLHEQIIDSGLAKIYQSHLDVAARIADDAGCPIRTQLLDGKASETLLDYAKKTRPWLMILGRTGVHSGEEMDLGGSTEHLMRLAPCNLLIAARTSRPPEDYEAAATMAWTIEARSLLDKAPPMVRGVAMTAIQRFALAEGFTMITSDVVDRALEQILPPETRTAMGITRSPVSHGPTRAGSFSLHYVCPPCGYVHPGKRPVRCPVCDEPGNLFRVGQTAEIPDNGEFERRETFDGVTLYWSKEAAARLDAITDDVLRKRVLHKIEKKARTQKRQQITADFVHEAMGLGPPAEPVSGGPHRPAASETEMESPQSRQDDSIPKAGEPQWDEPGRNRLLRAPEGFMRNEAKRAIEAYAREIGANLITLEIAEAGMARAREKMLGATVND